MDQQEDLRRFIVQLETVADHCDNTGLRAGGTTVREAIERLSRATPTPDVAELLRRTKQALSEATQEHGAFSVQFVTTLYSAIESLSRERAVLAEGLNAALRFGHNPDRKVELEYAEEIQRDIDADKAAVRKALVLIEGEKKEER